jgi:hypothetical protein
VTIDKVNLVLPELRHGPAALENEMLQLSQSGTQLVAFGHGPRRGFAGGIHTAQIYIKKVRKWRQ